MDSLAKQWLAIAARDLLAAEHELSFSEAVTESVCFHCQQAIEKALKAFLSSRSVVFPKTHDLDSLLNMCIDENSAFQKLDAESISLISDYAVDIRYPDSIIAPEIEAARDAYRTATDVIALVSELMADR